MKILAKNHSSYPRIGDKPEQQKLRRAFHQLDKEQITQEALAKIIDQNVVEVVREQLDTGCQLVTDGLIRAYDPVSHIATKIDGFEITGLLRFFDTNFYYRQPKVTGVLNYKQPLVKDEVAFAQSITGDRVTASMIGPYSLLRQSIVGGDFEEHLNQLTAIYAKELEHLKSSGVLLVQLDEPVILQKPADFELMKTAYSKMLSSGPHPEILLGLYFGNCSPLVDKFAEMPVDGVLFDFPYSPGLIDRLMGFPKNVGLGIIDGRNTKLEDAQTTAKAVGKLLTGMKDQNIYITTSCGLEFLPRQRANDKLKLCAEIAGILKGSKNE
jgi:5-methyltetrahydropteroyltriglutamate--homocysteine methyltransferase